MQQTSSRPFGSEDPEQQTEGIPLSTWYHRKGPQSNQRFFYAPNLEEFFSRVVFDRDREFNLKVSNIWPIGSMYGIYANIWGILMVNVTIYGIHGSNIWVQSLEFAIPRISLLRPWRIIPLGNHRVLPVASPEVFTSYFVWSTKQSPNSQNELLPPSNSVFSSRSN